MFDPVMSSSSTSDISHRGILGSQRCRMPAPATASKPMTITQKYQ